MTEETKLILGLMQIDNLCKLLEGNEYEKFMYGHLIQIQVELKRQLRHYGKTTVR